MAALKSLDLFSGAGGLTVGTRNTGISVVLANDNWRPAIRTYVYNNPETRMVAGDCSKAKIKRRILLLAKKLGVTIIFGGPPCQGFSIAGYRSCLDPRFNMVFQYIDYVSRLEPKLFLMENVRGILSAKTFQPNLSEEEKNQAIQAAEEVREYRHLKRVEAQRRLVPREFTIWQRVKKAYLSNKKLLKSFQEPLIDQILRRFKEIGYEVVHTTLNAVNYNVPQRRERVFFIGMKELPKTKIFPEPSKHVPTCRQALQSLEGRSEGYLPNHIFVKHSIKFVSKLRQVQPGQSLTGYKEAFYKLVADEPAPTVLGNHGSVFIHYKYPRCVTPREMARLQTFPDKYKFFGTKMDVLGQVGNSVPCNLSHVLVKQLATLCH